MRVIRQRESWDCAVAAINMVAPWMDYEAIRLTVAMVEPKWQGRRGLYVREVIEVAARLGVALEPTRRPAALETSTGVLRVYWDHRSQRAKANPGGHAVAVERAWIYDPMTGNALPWRDYQARHGASLGTLLVRV